MVNLSWYAVISRKEAAPIPGAEASMNSNRWGASIELSGPLRRLFDGVVIVRRSNLRRIQG
jgi:hypothetical protein